MTTDTRPLPGGSEQSGTVITPRSPLPTPDAADASLVLIHPSAPNLGRRHSLGRAPATLGRSSDSTVVTAHDSVSRHHARIDAGADGRYLVTDLGSTNGTFVNDVRVTARILRDGDYLRLGSCIFRFLAGGNVEAQYHEELYRMTVLDPLTNVYNRRYVTEVLRREVARCVRHHRPLAVALFDIDHFKSVNDSFGHTAGDRVLREVAARVGRLVRTEEVFARYGGEEFVVVLSESDAAAGAAFGERVRATVAAEPFWFESVARRLTVSVGVAATDGGEAVSADDLLNRADERMYQSKKAGRNRVTV
jgi:diguanylate cyclase (GGDEF)-like protein